MSAPFPTLHVGLWKVNNLQGITYSHDKYGFGYKKDDKDGYGWYFLFFFILYNSEDLS